ncbi:MULTISPECIES: glycosyltransferase family 2 protein [unclassified Lentimicrobium]|uniref:glycosyltransferase family 2 protein n=1 Tax=unclassified Lentimicrobium TaxID=2677434 RepID=UPI001556119F|nr:MULTISPECIES: glycosyltransferase family 2 protein [unclassified Lentimicrobium]NPD45565.1 glycosyltransferase family 2 protein [Lentimicrobium sp. S6]NPD83644.1 glycosyltransferase family 2 protein [Lentimicrobium sp. L6]
MKISVIIVNYYTSKFLPSLLRLLESEEELKEIIIVDNSMEEGLDEMVSKFRNTKLISNNENVGFGKAVNQASKSSESEWYLILNPDTMPVPGFLKKLLNGAISSNAIIAGPRFYLDEERQYKIPPALGANWWMQTALDLSTKSELDAKLLCYYWDIRFEKFWMEKEPFYEPFLSGACLLVRNDKSIFPTGKIFDERFFLYYEDTDLCVLAAENDYRIVCVPDAEVVHYWNQSPSSKKGELMMQSHQLYWNKYYEQLEYSNLVIEDFPISINDLGEFEAPPSFYFENSSNEKLDFEIGVNRVLIPAIKVKVEEGSFKISSSVWKLLANGYYFSRVKDRFGKTKALWRWKKF